MFFEMYAIAVIFVAKGHGLIAVIKPNKNAENRGKLLPSTSECKKSMTLIKISE
jgi:hypothetical protein